MQYIWIIMLAILYVMFLIGAIADIYDTYKYNKYHRKKGDAFSHKDLEDSTVIFIFLHFLTLFFISFGMWVFI